jgi:hypothetical protein
MPFPIYIGKYISWEQREIDFNSNGLIQLTPALNPSFSNPRSECQPHFLCALIQNAGLSER